MFFQKKREPEFDSLSFDELLSQADASDDAALKHRLLSLAEAQNPDDLGTQKRLLLLGHLYERNSRNIDFSLIKCYLYHGFEHPEKHTEAELAQMAKELFHDPRLLRCLQLAPRKTAFLSEYLQELALQYLRIFIAGDSSHTPRAFGISLSSKLSGYLAIPAGDVILNILSSPYLSPVEMDLAAKAFYKAFYLDQGGRVRELDRLLGPEVLALLARAEGEVDFCV